MLYYAILNGNGKRKRRGNSYLMCNFRNVQPVGIHGGRRRIHGRRELRAPLLVCRVTLRSVGMKLRLPLPQRCARSTRVCPGRIAQAPSASSATCSHIDALIGIWAPPSADGRCDNSWEHGHDVRLFDACRLHPRRPALHHDATPPIMCATNAAESRGRVPDAVERRVPSFVDIGACGGKGFL